MARLLAQPGQRPWAVDLVDGPEAADADPAAAERARVNVARAIKAARERITANAPDLGRHLETTLHTGVRCAYVSHARVPIHWRLGSERRSVRTNTWSPQTNACDERGEIARKEERHEAT